MPSKPRNSSLLVKINKEEKKRFLRICEEMDTSASREIRRFIKHFVRDNDSEPPPQS